MDDIERNSRTPVNLKGGGLLSFGNFETNIYLLSKNSLLFFISIVYGLYISCIFRIFSTQKSVVHFLVKKGFLLKLVSILKSNNI